jgi:hypothetical protein
MGGTKPPSSGEEEHHNQMVLLTLTQGWMVEMPDVDYIKKILAEVPENIDGGDMVDIIVNLIECYNMREQWLNVALCVSSILHQINELENEKNNATHH